MKYANEAQIKSNSWIIFLQHNSYTDMTAENSKDLPNKNPNNAGNTETASSKERLLPLVECNDFDQLVEE